MGVRAALSIALLALAGCSTADMGTGNMTADSERCRASVTESLVGRGHADGESSQDEYQNFQKAYVACMQAKGYDIKS